MHVKRTCGFEAGELCRHFIKPHFPNHWWHRNILLILEWMCESRTVSFDPLQVSSSEPAVPMQALLVGMLLGRMDSMAIEASRNGLRLVTGPASITAERMESMALCLLEARIYFAGLEQKYGAVAEAEQGCITRGSFSQVSFKQCLLLFR